MKQNQNFGNVATLDVQTTTSQKLNSFNTLNGNYKTTKKNLIGRASDGCIEYDHFNAEESAFRQNALLKCFGILVTNKEQRKAILIQLLEQVSGLQFVKNQPQIAPFNPMAQADTSFLQYQPKPTLTNQDPRIQKLNVWIAKKFSDGKNQEQIKAEMVANNIPSEAIDLVFPQKLDFGF